MKFTDKLKAMVTSRRVLIAAGTVIAIGCQDLFGIDLDGNQVAGIVVTVLGLIWADTKRTME